MIRRNYRPNAVVHKNEARSRKSSQTFFTGLAGSVFYGEFNLKECLKKNYIFKINMKFIQLCEKLN